jgi:hypothetical protein
MRYGVDKYIDVDVMINALVEKRPSTTSSSSGGVHIREGIE